MINFKRIFHSAIIQNEKDVTYRLGGLPRDTAKTLLSAPFAGGGVFGLEGHATVTDRSLNFFFPPNIKTNWEETKRNYIFKKLPYAKEILGMQLFTVKPSVFPLNLYATESMWESLQALTTKDISIVYQVLLSYRQDNWKERVQEQYNAYLNGIQTPADSKMIRSLQRRIDNSLSNALNWQMKHADIPEVSLKLSENGFRYSIRILLYGGDKRSRQTLSKEIRALLGQYGYLNDWEIVFSHREVIQNVIDRKLDNIGKQHVLSVSEALPFLMTDSVVHISQPTIVGKKEIVTHNKVDGSPFKLLPVGQGLLQVDGSEIAEKFIHALKELGKVKEEMVAKRTQSGPTMTKVTFELPQGLKLSDLTKNSVLQDLQTYMGMKHVQILQGENVGEFDVMLPQDKRQKIFLRDYVDTPEFLEFCKNNPLPIFIGVDEIGNPIFKCLTKIRHILVAGTTGSGKSVWMNQLILTLLLVRSPEELQFYMIDVKQVELPIYENFPHVQKVITDANESIKMLKQIQKEVDERYALFKEAGVKNIALYNRKAEEKLPYLVCVIDEYAELALRNEEVHDIIQSMAQLARAAGIHIIVATQDPRVDVIPGIIKSNLPGKIGFRCSNGNSYMTFLNTKPPFNLLGNGDGTMSFEGQMEEHIRFQGCLIIDDPHDDDLEGELIRRIADSMEDYEAEALPEVEDDGIEESELDKLKRVIVQTGETRVSQLRDLMKMNINRLNELMKDLVEEGWLSKPESKQQGYKLILGEEEQEQWRE